jgi:hypothetical protein
MKNLFANFEDFDAAPRLNSLLIQRLGMCPTHTTLERSGISATATATTEGDRVNREKERTRILERRLDRPRQFRSRRSTVWNNRISRQSKSQAYSEFTS